MLNAVHVPHARDSTVPTTGEGKLRAPTSLKRLQRRRDNCVDEPGERHGGAQGSQKSSPAGHRTRSTLSKSFAAPSPSISALSAPYYNP